LRDVARIEGRRADQSVHHPSERATPSAGHTSQVTARKGVNSRVAGVQPTSQRMLKNPGVKMPAAHSAADAKFAT
jgi:hypothetical protein